MFPNGNSLLAQDLAYHRLKTQLLSFQEFHLACFPKLHACALFSLFRGTGGGLVWDGSQAEAQSLELQCQVMCLSEIFLTSLGLCSTV